VADARAPPWLPEQRVVRDYETAKKTELELGGSRLEPNERPPIRVRKLEPNVHARNGGLHPKNQTPNQLVQERDALCPGGGGPTVSIRRQL
jgi:hypothetical protein